MASGGSLYSDKITQTQDLIANKRSELAENRNVYEAILQFYSPGALIETDIADLKEILKHKKISIYKTEAPTFKECVYNLIDENPEISSAKGMLRYYEACDSFDWTEVEKAEIIIGDILSKDIYGWEPDFWTLFKNQTENICKLTLVVAEI